ncbi:DUF4982 domain-containing protein [Aquimarina sp. ERC-38]|uniref:glycoside hydrolase family 2 TIM barrel-domain containing protein n=1 Tax=Aquimarina sp. ERC-38 TaxID=2949996 RepID=UPI002247D45F|nr:glycoside hydrolase family 2 TIM barrel-domain containing protein [Aquimarina sp. ERC-38]UZO82218.1 DUF4982 domain-containing protein [Aquimarina sp. ERC-38]
MIKVNSILCLLYTFLISIQAFTQENYGVVKVNQDWKFKILKDTRISEEGFELPDYDDSQWEMVTLPHTAHIEPLVVNNQWQGNCWYRKEISLPENDTDKKVFLELEAAMNYSKIWINGTEVSTHHGGYLPVVVDATKYLKKDTKNVIAIRLNNEDNEITGPKPLKTLDFNMYGGLYRNAFLTFKEKVYISHPVLADKVAGGGVFISFPKVAKESSTVRIKTHVVNEEGSDSNITLVNTISFQDKVIIKKEIVTTIVAGKDAELSMNLDVINSKLWSPENPNLYVLETAIINNGKIVDTQRTRFGIREFTFDSNNQLHINGEKTFLRGVNRHQEYPFIGYALSDNAQYRDAKKIKEGGFNYIRLSHYPQSPAFMGACDELGIVVIDAIMGWQFYKDTDSFRNYCYRSATELIRRDRNRPSVLAWEVSLNETKMPVFFMEKLHKIVHAEYPGEHVYSCGWMDEVYDIYLQARQHRILHPHKLKDKPYSVSEYGDWEYYSKNAGLNQDKLPNDLRTEKSSRQARSFGEERLLNQAYNLQESHNDNLNTVAYSDSYWVMYDYNRGYHPDIEYSGIMDIFRLPKFGYYFYQSQRDAIEGNVLKIATYWNEKSPKDVKVFSNAEEVTLFLNDKVIGTQKPDSGKNTDKLSHPPFTFTLPSFKAGTLKAIGYINGKQVSEDLVHTPKAPTKLKIWLDKSGKEPQSGVNDVVFCYIAAMDENGTVNPNFSEEIKVSLEGAASVINPEKLEAEAGIATALLRIGNAKGVLKVSATSKKLKGTAQFNIQ